MDFINKLKSVFIVDEGQETIVPDNSVSENNSSVETNVKNDISPEDSQKFIDILFRALEEKNVQGFDYLEFMQSISNIKKQNLTDDEIKLFQTGFSLAQTMNVSKNALIESGKHYLNVLEEEKSHFHSSLTNNAKAKLDEKNKEIIDLQKSLADDKVRLEALRNTIMKNEQRKNSLTEELAQAEQKVNSVKAAFNTAFLSLSEKIKTDIGKIEKYL
jgi:hypothetical protein